VARVIGERCASAMATRARCEVGEMKRKPWGSALPLTRDRESTWRWGSEEVDGGDLKLVSGMLWRRRRGVEGGFGFGEVRGLFWSPLYRTIGRETSGQREVVRRPVRCAIIPCEWGGDSSGCLLL
jgi:hypothetical protein